MQNPYKSVEWKKMTEKARNIFLNMYLLLKFEPTLTYNKAKNPINPKEEFHMVVMFDFQSGPNEENINRTFHRRLLPNFN